MTRCPYKLKEVPVGECWIWWWGCTEGLGFARLFHNFDTMKIYSAKHSGSIKQMVTNYFSDYEKVNTDDTDTKQN
jgi:hypothetical protein